jgi:molybdopterin-guanine dinucleotide biosynthesis protein A
MLDPAACAAVVLAGGRSRRMGTDKAALPHPFGGTLLSHQLGVVASAGLGPSYVSLRHDQAVPALPPGVDVVRDDGSTGPLGGIVAALRRSPLPWLLVLAVDLPHVTTADLILLLGAAVPRGVVPRSADGLEPLGAIYPRSWLSAAEQALHQHQLSLRSLVAAPTAEPWFDFPTWPTGKTFVNWNHPRDLAKEV